MNNLNRDLDLYANNPEDVFEAQLNQSISELFEENIDAIVCNNYFVLLRPLNNSKHVNCVDQYGCFVLKNNEYSLLHDNILTLRGLTLGKSLKTRAQDSSNYLYASKIFEFKRNLLFIEQLWINKYASYVKELLTTRISEGIPIIKHDAVRIIWADFVEKQASLEQTVNGLKNARKLTQNDMFDLARRLIREACEHLAKLAGGRAYLLDQSVEMLWLFDIMNKIYFIEG